MKNLIPIPAKLADFCREFEDGLANSFLQPQVEKKLSLDEQQLVLSLRSNLEKFLRTVNSVVECAMDDRRESLSAVDIEDEKQKITEKNLQLIQKGPMKAPLLLCVDDSEFVRTLMRAILGSTYRIVFAFNGVHALELLEKYKPDLIISDMLMPEMNGDELLKRVRSHLLHSRIPYVLLTGKDSATQRVQLLEGGANDYITKPFDGAELLARIGVQLKLVSQERRLREDLLAARAIQQNLLPSRRQILNGVSLDALFQPADELSGDFYDYAANGNWIYIYIADVMAHGTAAAQVTYLIKSLLTEQLLHFSREPLLPVIMANVADRFAAFKLDFSVGLQIARLNPTTRELQYCASNAPSPILIQDESVTEVKVETGPVIYAPSHRPNQNFPVATVQLKGGNQFYMLTDGCYEFMLDGTERVYGTRRLSDLIFENSQLDSKIWDEQMLGRLKKEFGKDQFPDDITLLRISLPG